MTNRNSSICMGFEYNPFTPGYDFFPWLEAVSSEIKRSKLDRVVFDFYTESWRRQDGYEPSNAETKMLIEQLEVGNFAVFSYILGCQETGEGVVVDPAAEVDRILKTCKSQNITKIKYIINTHSHADHAGGNRKLKEATGAEIIVHRDDAESLANPADFILQIFNCEASPPADRTVQEGEVIAFGNEQLKVIHTPGHTPGGICLYTPGYVITGDTLFVGAVGRTDLPGGSTQILIGSIQSKLISLPEDTVVLPGHNYGHSPRSTIGQEKRFNPFLN